jgi:DNA polymerase III epsilon subunit-like protein
MHYNACLDKLNELFSQSQVIDTETTSRDFKIAEVVQYASGTWRFDTCEFIVDQDKLFKPLTPMAPDVCAVHYISNRMVADKPHFDSAASTIQAELNAYKYIVGHNVFYDQRVLERYGIKLPATICTMRLAKKLYNSDPNVTAYNLSYLRYALDLPVDDNLKAHTAEADVAVTGCLYTTLVADAIAGGHLDLDSNISLGDQIVAWLEEPIILSVMPFGKHTGKRFNEVPVEYWRWAFENLPALNENAPEFDKDLAASASKAVEELLGD